MWYSAKGKLNYNGNWLILNCSNSIVNYYAWWCQRLVWKKGSTPLHLAHVTVVAGKYQDVSRHENWKKHQGKIVDFQYSNVIEFDKQKGGTYFWLPVRCEFLKQVREELGLTPYPKWQYHLTCCYIQN